MDAHRSKIYEDRKFAAAIQGIDLEAGKKPTSGALERVKENVVKRLGGKDKKLANPNDITALRGKRANDLGFGIGMGLDYVMLDASGNPVKSL